ncbi:hypothetical protein DFJ43DRAFT_1039139 [Lentinula guzmanii]|uniref:Uncharacterized protein n=1 Tax=Lentinula guzmanii TaxID=2804957 RepID=A0AA38N0C1_9AGAR|nr:hypothetical protein DFJ43DRAFT_1039139 [Lentinula guzmanii]
MLFCVDYGIAYNQILILNLDYALLELAIENSVAFPQLHRVYSLDAVEIFTTHLRPCDMLEFIGSEMSNIVGTCAFHRITLNCQASHTLICFCPAQMISHPNSEFQRVFTTAMHVRINGICSRCWCPQHFAFAHSANLNCTKDPQNGYADFWLILMYLILRNTYLRERIFTFIGIAGDVFQGNIRSYASWLTTPAVNYRQSGSDHRITNMVTLAYVYFLLKSRGNIVIPSIGLKVDRM